MALASDEQLRERQTARFHVLVAPLQRWRRANRVGVCAREDRANLTAGFGVWLARGGQVFPPPRFACSRVRGLITSVIVIGLACEKPPTVAPPPDPTCVQKVNFSGLVRKKLDLLFVIDDSPAMASMEARLWPQLPHLLEALIDPTTREYPNLHVAVVSSSLGAGRYDDVPGCLADTAGDVGGRFSHPEGSGLANGATFMRLNDPQVNFSGQPGDVFACMARLGHAGCGFPQPLAAARRALEKAGDATDPDNGGFLRHDAALAVIVITNGDDCSVPSDSDLFDPAQTRLSDRYGALATYRCSEFGLLCGGQAPPHAPPSDGGGLILDACMPAEASGRLTAVQDLRSFFQGLKENPDDILVAVAAGPATPVVIGGHDVALADGTTEREPARQPSCTAAPGDGATPGVRLKSWVDGFGYNGIFYPACANALERILGAVASSRQEKLGPLCVSAAVLPTDTGTPNCVVEQTQIDERGTRVSWPLPLCDPDVTIQPCWRLTPQASECSGNGGQRFQVCRDSACNGHNLLDAPVTIHVACQVTCP